MRLCFSFALALSSLVSMQAQERGGLSQNAVPVMKSDSSGSSSNALVVRIRDKCDPATFDLNVFPGACIGDGNVTFDAFIAELTEDKKVGAWRFNPDQTDATPGQPFVLESRAGETHTFTKVEEFGGGVVPMLNQLSGNKETRPECLNSPAPSINVVVPPGSITPGFLPADKGEQKFQCCIHPWMRLVVNARAK